MIQDTCIIKGAKTQDQGCLVCHLYRFLSQKQTLNVVKLGLKPVVKKFFTKIYYVMQLDFNNIGDTKSYKNTHNH